MKATKLFILILLIQITLFGANYEEKDFYGTWQGDVMAPLSGGLSLRIVGENTYTKNSESYGNLMFQLYMKEKNKNMLLITAPISEFSLWFVKDGFLYEKSLNVDIGELIINEEAQADYVYEYMPIMKTFISSLENEIQKKPQSKMRILYLSHNKIRLVEEGITVELKRK